MKGVIVAALISLYASNGKIADTVVADISRVPNVECEIQAQVQVANKNLAQLQALPDTIRKYVKQ